MILRPKARYTLYRHDLKNLTPRIAVDAVSGRHAARRGDRRQSPRAHSVRRATKSLCIRKNPINQSHRQAFRPD
jgi:hypothetical protein